MKSRQISTTSTTLRPAADEVHEKVTATMNAQIGSSRHATSSAVIDNGVSIPQILVEHVVAEPARIESSSQVSVDSEDPMTAAASLPLPLELVVSHTTQSFKGLTVWHETQYACLSRGKTD